MNLKKILCGTLGASLLLSSTACSAAPAQQAAPAASAVSQTQAQSQNAAQTQQAAKSPKYVFLFIGDGMSYPQFQAASDYLGALDDPDYVKALPSIDYEKREGELNGPKRLQMEIQIRTMAMNFWATVEHSLQYKYKRNIPEHIKERLLSAADAIITLDNEMSTVRSEIMDAQISFRIQANIVADILNNIQNLYRVANKREILKIQDEFYRIYAMNDIDQLERFDRQLDMIAEGYRAQSLPTEE